MNCPICDCAKCTELPFESISFKRPIIRCKSCGFSWVSKEFTQEEEIASQKKSSGVFGTNRKRDKFYLDRVKNLYLRRNVKTILEIGTAPKHHFLDSLHEIFPFAQLHSTDILTQSLPGYIKFVPSIKKSFDLIFCIHTLEHMPLSDFRESVNAITEHGKNIFVEVPNCPNEARIRESSKHPHNLFFTVAVLKKLFPESKGFRVSEVDKVAMVERTNQPLPTPNKLVHAFTGKQVGKTSSNKKVSVLILTFNRLKVASKFIPIICDNAGDSEILICDNGSSDGTAKWVYDFAESHPKVTKVIFKKNNRGMESFNDLANEASGDYIIKIDDDILPPKNFAHRLARAFERINEPKLLFLGWDMPWGVNRPTNEGTFATRSSKSPYSNGRGKILSWKDAEVYLAYNPRKWLINGACRLCRRDKFLEIGGHPKGIIYGVDAKISLVASIHGYWIGYYSPKDLIQHCGNHDTPSHRKFKDIELRKARRLRKKHEEQARS